MNYELCEAFADNGEFSHWRIVDIDTGAFVWSQDPEEDFSRGVTIYESDPRLILAFDSICEFSANPNELLQILSCLRFTSKDRAKNPS